MLKRLTLVALALALIVPASASAEVTIKVGKGKFHEEKYRETTYPNGFRLKGKTGSYRGPVALELDGFPYDGSYIDYASAATNDKGEYVFPNVVIGRNARVRVRAGSERSRTIELYLHPGLKWKDRVSGDYLHLTVTFSMPSGWAPPEPGGFFVYMLKTKENRLRRLGGARTLVQVADGEWRYQGKARLPSSRKGYRFYTFFCNRGLAAAGYGRMWPIDRGCGKKVIKG
jgi:hypothetical protein